MLQQNSSEYRGFRTAGIRLTEELLPELAEHRTEFLGDKLLAIHQFDKAHIVMLTEKELIPRDAGVSMLRQLRQMENDGIERVRMEAQGGMHSGEQYLIRMLGEDVGGYIHLGRSSGDLGAVSRRITARNHLVTTLRLINEVRTVILDLADSYLDTVMPGYTHGQNAQPTTYGHWLSMWAAVLRRDFQRGLALLGRLNESPAGAAILTGSDFPLDRQRTARLLGFTGVIPHTMDAILSHDVDCLECATVLAIHANNLARLGDDFELWMTSEYSFVDLPDRFCGTSSIMMQKRNPHFSEKAKALTSQADGAVVSALSVERGSTGLAILERRVTEDALWDLFKNLHTMLKQSVLVLPEIIVNAERMREVAESYWAQAADVAGMLVRTHSIPWRTAHQIVGILVRLSSERGARPTDVTSELLDEASVLYWGKPLGVSPSDLSDSLDVTASVRRRTLFGGPAPSAVSPILSDERSLLASDREKFGVYESAIEGGLDELERTIDALVK